MQDRLNYQENQEFNKYCIEKLIQALTDIKEIAMKYQDCCKGCKEYGTDCINCDKPAYEKMGNQILTKINEVLDNQ